MQYRYREHGPHPSLRLLVDRLWTLTPRSDDDGPTGLRLLPDGGTDLIVRVPSDGSPSQLFVSGVFSSHHMMSLCGVRALVGARLHPAAAGAMLGHPGSSFTDASVPVDDLSTRWTRGGTACQELTTAAAARRLLERLLSKRRDTALRCRDRKIEHAVARIDERPGVSIRSLAAHVDLGERQLRRRFQSAVGLSPSSYAAVVRLGHTVQVGRVGRVLNPRPAHGTWVRTAIAAGYYDQSHMIGEFRKLVGLSPDAWRREVSDPERTPRCA